MNASFLQLSTISTGIVRSIASVVALTVMAIIVSVVPKTLCAEPPSEIPLKKIEFFENEIRPILVKHCYQCHSNEKKVKGGLLLDSRHGWETGGDSGPAIVVGKPEESLLIEALRHESFEMPPSGPLPDVVIKDFHQWIQEGAVDPRQQTTPQEDAHQYTPIEPQDLWSLQPVTDPKPPTIKRQDWPFTDVDRFVLARLEASDLAPVPDAPDRRLIRRIHLDLTGLPPSPEFMNDWILRLQGSELKTAHTRQRVISELTDQLLATKQFGEKWGRHWLDTARYAESNGNNRNRVYRYAWRYRNWVIDSLNNDKPYDQFLKEQLAGDLMPYASKKQRNDQRIATGFLAIGAKPYYPTIVPFDPEEPDRARYDWAAEQIDATMSGMMGLTVGCARCHDHKFDPIPTRDYYALAGIFRSTNPRFGMFWDLFGVDEGQAQRDFLYDFNLLVLNDEILDQITPLQKQYKPLVIEQNRIDLRSRHWPEQIERMQAKIDQDSNLSPKAISDLKAGIAQRREQLAEDKVRLVEILRQKQQLKDEFEFQVDQTVGVEDADAPANVELRIDGEHAKRGPVVPRGFLSTVVFDDAPQTINTDQSGRLELADWITHPNNPLTARVAVNRIWHHLFGRGIIKTLDNFGSAGESPTHPQLLDHLAHQFVHQFGWSQKKLIQHLVLSRTYQLDSVETEATKSHFQTDPDNTLYWRMSPRRLDAEAIRDSMLSVAGRLDLKRPNGSPTVDFDYYADIRHEDRQVALNMLAGNLRTIYVPTLRGHHHQLYELFDYPDDESVNSARNSSNVPTQALFMMNNPLVMTYASNVVDRLDDEGLQSDTEKLHRLYELCFGRSPLEVEIQADLRFLNDQKTDSSHQQAWQRLVHSFLISGEFLYKR